MHCKFIYIIYIIFFIYFKILICPNYPKIILFFIMINESPLIIKIPFPNHYLKNLIFF